MTIQIHRDPATAERLDVVKEFYRHLEDGNVPAVLELLHPAVEWTEAEGFPYFSGTWIGPEAVFNNLFKKLGEDWIDFAATADDYVIEGSNVVSFGHYSGTYRQTGKSMRAAFAHRWSVGDGKITSFLMYADTVKVREALMPDDDTGHGAHISL